MAWKFIGFVARLAFAGALLLPAVYLVRPATARLDAFLIACSLAGGIHEACRLTRDDASR